MFDFLNLEVRVWKSDEWPENRVSIACTDSKHAVMISPRYATVEQAEANARHIVHCVNYHERLVEALGAIVYADSPDNECMMIRKAKKLLDELDTKGEE